MSTDITDALAAFAAAAVRLSDLWQADNYGPADRILTETYPTCIPMSFDEYVAELWAWHEAVLDAS